MVGKCSATNKDGTPCSGQPYRDGFCRWHHPDLAEEQRAWRVKGGQAKSNRARAKKALPSELMSMAEVQSYLGVAMKGVLTGKIEPGVGTALANIARAMRDVGAAAELESQLADMRRQIADISDRRPA